MPNTVLPFRIESYSCKMAGNDKKLFKLISQEGGVGPLDLQALSPPQTLLSHSPTKYVHHIHSEVMIYMYLFTVLLISFLSTGYVHSIFMEQISFNCIL